MKCPSCNVALVMSERQGIEIDYCPECRGIWLDRGELDKIIERSANEAPVAPQAPPPPQQRSQQGYSQQPDHGYGHGHKPYKKHKHWLQEIFD
jgi:Zn-finger nucleic acid-binding protein